MKKVLTVLAVLVLFAGVVFADPIATPNTSNEIPAQGEKETHKITVTTWVDVVLPVFGFQVDDRVITNEAAQFDDAAELTAVDTAYIRGNSADAAQGNDIANSAITENFTIYSLDKKANIVKTFDFTVTAEAFKHSETNYTTKGDITIEYAPATVSEDEHIEASALTKTVETVETTVGIKAAFSGKQKTDNVLLGTVTVTWPKDVDAVPGAYTADVVLTVTAE